MKEVFFAMLPIVGIVLILQAVGVAKLSDELLINFGIGTIFVFFGQIIFLVGIDNGIMPMGSMVGAAVTKRGKLWLIMVVGFAFGFLATIAEPATRVMGGQVNSVDNGVSVIVLMLVISLGMGLFVCLALYRMFKGIPLSKMLLVTYIAIFAMAIILEFVAPKFVSVSFDAGGVTTGPMTVPFILALGMGVASVRGKAKSEDSFGIVGLASAGPIIAVIIMGYILGDGGSSGNQQAQEALSLGEMLISTLGDVAVALLPIVSIFLLFQFIFIKLSRKNLLKILLGATVTFVGLLLFLTGVSFGFSQTGLVMGESLGDLPSSALAIIVAVALGFFVVYTEPSIVVLGKQVEQVTNGAIGKKTLMNALAICISLAVGLGAIRAIFGISIWYFIIPGYLLAMICMRFSPPIFTAIAFDSGGVASGTLTSTFILPFIMGICQSAGGDILTSAFGVVALIAMTPLFTIQIVGIVYRIKLKQNTVHTTEDQITADDIADISIGHALDNNRSAHNQDVIFDQALLKEMREDIDFSGLSEE